MATHIGALMMLIGGVISISDIILEMCTILAKWFTKTPYVMREYISEEAKKAGVFLLCIGAIVTGIGIIQKIDMVEILHSFLMVKI